MHPIVKEGYPFIFYAAGTALAAFYLGGLPAAIPFAVLALYFSYFFRNPKRNAPKDGNILYAPADGTVMGVEDIFDNEYLDAPAKKVTIFLSVLNVHVNRSPMDGEINYRRIPAGITHRRIKTAPLLKTNAMPSALKMTACAYSLYRLPVF